ncbi:MAG: Bug family tripartite tricarboxylate transporter substrate binding protein [Lautropia sp.]
MTAKRRHVLAAAGLLMACAMPPALAQEWPSRSVRFVVAWPPGGGGDFVGRVLAQKYSELLGQPFVIDNKPGASGTIGTDWASKQTADGYIFVLSQANNSVIAPNVLKVAFDPVKDFTPIAYIGFVPNVLVVPAGSASKSVAGLIETAKANPGRLTYASAGNGSTQHMAGAMFSQIIGSPLTHVPYKGSGLALTDLVAGRVDMNFDTMPSILGSVRSDKLRALAVSTSQRVPQLPGVPTFAEVGITGLANVKNWYGVSAPRGLPAPIVERMAQATRTALQDPAVREKLEQQGLIFEGPATSAEFARFIEDDVGRYAKLVKDLKITVD